jgi:hypothetical protein
MRIAGFIWLVPLMLTGCVVCGEDKLSETSSPNNKYVATVFRRGCGATSGFLYHVNLRRSDNSFSSDNTGVIEEGQVFLIREGKIKISWNDDKNLRITCEGCPKDRKPTMESLWNDVTVSYDFP